MFIYLIYIFYIIGYLIYLSTFLYYISLSFCAENNPDQWYQSILIIFFFQCMSLTRSEYRNLGLKLVSLEENNSLIPKKSSMVEEKKNDREKYSINHLLEQALM
jgi:hypothetical protein